MQGLSVRVRGTVQGVGFRPFIYQLAERHGLTGWVRNTGGQVEIELDGDEQALAEFLGELRRESPPLARIEELLSEQRPAAGYAAFEIRRSHEDGGWQAIPPDVATCDACLSELFDPRDRRYRYPFINCTHCGPRFTIIDGLPYDRSRTTMRHFPMCEACRREYENPRDRRFHAQPVACPACGPKIWMHLPATPAPAVDPIDLCVSLLKAGDIIAVKGLGGFQLACDASNDDAVRRLRLRKRRYGKPFALMVPDVESARELCVISPAEAAVLRSPERPIVLAKRRAAARAASELAPGLDTLGLMLPYTPLHHLLLRGFEGPLVMTSGNVSEEPIAIGNLEALERLGEIADGFLLHDRDIYARYDDSVARVIDGAAVPIRRARGYAPAPIALPFEVGNEILACGAQQKSTFCALKGSNAFLSPHIGDLENLETLEHFQATLDLFQRLFRLKPRIIAHDLHPDYLSSRFARELPLDGGLRIEVQHHHAHVVSAMVEHGLRDPVIGVAYDGTGYGEDAAVWGGEILIADWASFRRAAHLRYVPMLGGEGAIRKPYRMAAAHLWALGAERAAEFEPFFAELPGGEREILRRQFEERWNAPLTSSCGRLFDAAAALIGIRREALYEGQPAIELEAAADPNVDRGYPFELTLDEGRWIMDPGPALAALWREGRAGVPVSEIAAAFHNTVAAFTVDACRAIRAEHGLRQVVLSGGCFQNALLTARLADGLARAGFEVFTHHAVPPNDGGIALGQAVVAYARTEES